MSRTRGLGFFLVVVVHQLLHLLFEKVHGEGGKGGSGSSKTKEWNRAVGQKDQFRSMRGQKKEGLFKADGSPNARRGPLFYHTSQRG